MTALSEAAILSLAEQEMRRRAALREDILSGCFPEQRQAIEDDALLKAFFCTRRAGKSWAIGGDLFLTGLEHPGSSCLYLALTRDTARGIMNKDIFHVANERYELGAVWKASDMTWTLPNGSVIYLRGADVNKYEIAKVVGQKYRKAVLDEASKYRHDLRTMVYEALLPAMGDDLGTIIMSGTPSNNTTSLFFDVTTGKEPGWSTHHWHWRDNVYKRANIQKMHDKFLSSNPAYVETPMYKQEWQGEWCIDTSALVYRYREDLNTAACLPRPPAEYTYLLGADLGFNDPTAFVVGAYHEFDPTLYIVHASKQSNMIVSAVAERIRAMWNQPKPMVWRKAQWPFSAIVMDCANLQAVEEMRQKHGLQVIEAAKKTDKRGTIEAFNSDLMTGRIKLLPDAMALADEWRTLIWSELDRKKMPPKWVEDPRLPNHICDGALYLWRKARNYDAREEPAKVDVHASEYGDKHFAQMLAERAKQKPGGGMFPGRVSIGMPQGWGR